MIKYIVFLNWFLLAPFLHAQVSNVTWALAPGQDQINVNYDLAPDRFFDVYIEALLDGKVIKPINISGDVGKYIKGGAGKKTTWDILRDNLELEGKLEIKVIAIDLLDDIAGKKAGEKEAPSALKTGGNQKITAIAGLVLGLGSAVYGLSLESKSKDLYAVYTANRLEQASVYQQISREEHYQQANRKHKSALLLLSTGGVATLFSVYQFIRGGKETKLSQTRPSKLQLSPHFTTQWYDHQAHVLPGAMATLRF